MANDCPGSCLGQLTNIQTLGHTSSHQATIPPWQAHCTGADLRVFTQVSQDVQSTKSDPILFKSVVLPQHEAATSKPELAHWDTCSPALRVAYARLRAMNELFSHASGNERFTIVDALNYSKPLHPSGAL